MKNKLCSLFAVFIAASLILSGCGGKNSSDGAEDNLGLYEEAAETERNSVTYKITDGQNNFLLTLSLENGFISAIVENNSFNMARSEITPPEGFLIPSSLGEACRIITDNTDSTDEENIPDIIEFIFQGEDGKNACTFCQIKDDLLCEIQIFTDGNSVPYITGTSFYRTEADKFISSIIVDESIGIVPDISDMVKIRTYKFNSEENTLDGRLEKLSPENTLYFGYAYWGLANNAASYFTDQTLPVSDMKNFKEVTDGNSPQFFFKTDDPRYPDAASLKKTLRKLFKKDLAESIFENAPQKYRDFDGELYTLMGQSTRDMSLGMLTFSSYTVLDGGDKIVYTSKQEKYDDNGKFTGYVDGGDFTIRRSESSSGEFRGWIITGYRYPYS